MIINNVDFDAVTQDALEAARKIASEGWDELSDIVENIGKSLSNDIAFVAKKKASGEFDEPDAKVFLEDQKIVARMRLRSVAIITLKIAEQIWNAIINVFNAAINKAIGWTLL
jgi:hypothetical protein